jgi:protein phosphatase methylesterase 1
MAGALKYAADVLCQRDLLTMSEFERNLLRKKVLGHERRSAFDSVNSLRRVDVEEEDEEGDALGSLGMPSRAPQKRMVKVQARDWRGFFKQNVQLEVSKGRTFNVFYNPPKDDTSPIFIFHHGTGSSGLSFAVVSSRIQSIMRRDSENAPMTAKDDQRVAGTLSFDMRGHGKTVVDQITIDYNLETLTEDFLLVCEEMAEKEAWGSQPLILVGHSLGGAVVTNAALKKRLSNVLGVVVLDAVEGPALEAVKDMDKVLATWPKQFDSVESAIEWHLTSMTLRNKESASVSVPGIIKQKLDGSRTWTWILNPKITQPFWINWFTGLSNNFLAVPAARLLILAGTDRLDKELMIGQMQGKYQLIVFSESGHFIQEDEPDKTALAVSIRFNELVCSRTLLRLNVFFLPRFRFSWAFE